MYLNSCKQSQQKLVLIVSADQELEVKIKILPHFLDDIPTPNNPA